MKINIKSNQPVQVLFPRVTNWTTNLDFLSLSLSLHSFLPVNCQGKLTSQCHPFYFSLPPDSIFPRSSDYSDTF